MVACVLSAIGCFLSCALLGFPETGGVRFTWVLLWIAGWFGARAFGRIPQRRDQVCFGILGACFTLAFALGYRLDLNGATGFDGLLLSLGVALCFAPATGQAAWILHHRLTACNPGPEIRERRVLGFSMVWLLLAWLPMLLAFYPGIHAYDTFSQIPTYLQGSFTTHHPLLHTLVTGWLYDQGVLLGDAALGLLLYSVLQMVLLAYSLGRGLAYLGRLRCPRWARVGLLALFCLVPQYSLHALGCTKDIPFAAFITLYVLRLHRLFHEPELLRSPRFMAGTVVVGVFMLLFRNNAPYALVLLVPFAVALIGRGWRLRMAVLLAVTLVLSAGIQQGLKLATQAESGLINEMLCIPAQQLSRVISIHELEDPVSYEILDYVPHAQQYNESRADPVKLHLKVQKPEDLWGFIKLWGREFFHYPIEYIDAFLLQCKGYWFLDDTLFTQNVGAIYLWFYDNLGVQQNSLLPGLRQAMLDLFEENHYRSVPLFSLLIQPALYTWICLFVLICAICRRDRALALSILCVLTYLFTLCLGPMVANRYSFCVTTSAPLLLAMLCVRQPPKSKNLAKQQFVSK